MTLPGDIVRLIGTPFALAERSTQAEVAAELGMSVRQVQRLEELALAWLTLAMCHAIREEIGDVPAVPRRFGCRVPENVAETDPRARHVARSLSPSGRRRPFIERRAGTPIPRRFTRTKKP